MKNALLYLLIATLAFIANYYAWSAIFRWVGIEQARMTIQTTQPLE